jgi:mannonate dehydratase
VTEDYSQMRFEQTWRWFGPQDPITLKEIRQTGAVGIVSALHHIPVGHVWTDDEIHKRKQMITAEGLRWSVAESVPVHEDIKTRKGRYQHYIDNYKESIRNLGLCGIDTICYNFMPLLDWSRTDLKVAFKDGSITTQFETKAFAAFDLFILRRPGAMLSYTEEQISSAQRYYANLNDQERERLEATVLLGLPGSLVTSTLEEFRSALGNYDGITSNDLREHLYSFINEIIPVAEESGVFMAIHPDDPPWPLLGLPRIVSNKQDVEHLLRVNNSNHNGLTLCTGSFGAGINNDLVDMAESFAGRINFVHLRNVRRNSDGDFLEDNHLDGDIDIFGVMKALIIEQRRRAKEGRKDRRLPFRPDHGHLMSPDLNKEGIYPGYSLFGRMRGLAELRGLELGIRRSL